MQQIVRVQWRISTRLRNYFFLRRQLGPQYLALLRFFLNHRTFMRSECPERVGKSPTQLMTGQPHPHWLELFSSGFNAPNSPPQNLSFAYSSVLTSYLL